MGLKTQTNCEKCNSHYPKALNGLSHVRCQYKEPCYNALVVKGNCVSCQIKKCPFLMSVEVLEKLPHYFKAILAVGALPFDFEIRLLPCW